MATCIVEDPQPLSIFCSPSITTTMKTSSSCKTINNDCHQPFVFHCHSNTTELCNDELIKKRPFNRSFTYCASIDSNRIRMDGSCFLPAVSINPSDETSSNSTRPKTLLPPGSPVELAVPLFRSFFSHPATTFNPLVQIDDNAFEPLKFTSVPELVSPPLKRHRSQTLTEPTIPVIYTPISYPPSSIHLLNPSEIAEKLQGYASMSIFDCGSPFRHSESRIRNSVLLQVADKISRKRFKTNPKRESMFNLKQMKQCDFILLYDDTNSHSDHCRTSINFSVKDQQISAAIKCVCEEIQSSLADQHPPILILNCAFNDFFDLYPNLCESPEAHSSPSSPVSDTNDESAISRVMTVPPPHTAPVLPTMINQEDLYSFPMTHILHGIFIGSESNAKNLQDLTSEKIEYIVNVTSHVPLYHSEQMHYCHLPADDTPKQDLIAYFDQAFHFIRHAIENNGKVLVHCVAGISRSPAIVISFLMRYAQMTMNDAYDLVKRKRSIVGPNLNFMGQLMQYEKKLRENK